MQDLKFRSRSVIRSSDPILPIRSDIRNVQKKVPHRIESHTAAAYVNEDIHLERFEADIVLKPGCGLEADPEGFFGARELRRKLPTYADVYVDGPKFCVEFKVCIGFVVAVRNR